MRNQLEWILGITVLLAGAVQADDPKPTGDLKSMQGFWAGSWGGGERNGVVFQPVLAELVIHGQRGEFVGFRSAHSFQGTIHVDATKKQIRFSTVTADDKQPTREWEYTYELKGDSLTLTDADKISVSLQRQNRSDNPLANVVVELVLADGINEAGNLVVTQFAVLQHRSGPPHYLGETRAIRTKDATVLQLQESAVKRITLEEARTALRKGTPVVVAHRSDEAPSEYQSHQLWKRVGTAAPDSEAAWQTYARLLKPGTLIFIFPAVAKVPEP